MKGNADADGPLSDAVDHFHRHGFTPPFRLARPPASPMDLLNAVETAPWRATSDPYYCRHLDNAAVLHLCCDDAILARLKAILGSDLLLWSSSFWLRDETLPPVPWHQDVYHWPVSLTVTAWIALTDVSSTTGCLSVAPGSHVRLWGQQLAENALFEAQSVCRPAGERVVPLEMSAGQAVLFSDRLLHRSNENSARAVRVALAARYTVPQIDLHQDLLPFFPGHEAVLVSGSDDFGINDVRRRQADHR